MKNTMSRVLYSKDRKKRNVWLFDAGLHTLGLKQEEEEWDQEFVERFLIKFIEGCRNRGGNKYKDYILHHRKGDKYISVLGIK